MGEAAEKVPPTYKRTLPAGMIPWKPGQSGNPTGRNAVTALMSRIRETCGNGDRLIAVLEDALAHDNWAVRLKAVEILFERGWGKAFQPVALGGEKGSALDLSKLSTDELKTFVVAMAKITGVDVGSQPAPPA